MKFNIKKGNNKDRSGLPNSEHSDKVFLTPIKKLIFLITGFAGFIWFLARVIPKPSRAYYPCMKIAFPFATSFVIYITGLISSVFFFKKAGKYFTEKKYLLVIIFVFVAIVSAGFAFTGRAEKAVAANTKGTVFDDPLGPNKPIGDAKGVIPGRVVWIHNPDATNENCLNTKVSEAYFAEKNCDQNVVDIMFSSALKKLTDKTTEAEAWDAVFRYFNNNHGKGDTGFKSDETIFIKVNAVTAYNGATANGGKQPENSAIEYDTTPQTILSLLRQLVNVAGVPQKNIYVGDPIADLWDHMYQKFHSEFPDIKYVTKRNISNRYKLTASTKVGIDYSDRGKVMTNLPSHQHKFFKEMMEADYLINMPVMKGHRWGGITFGAKNHFGSNTSDGSWQLHKGLMDGNDDYDEEGRRYDYGMYRVMVDLMGNKYLGGNTLLYYMDALFSTSHEHQPPQKFRTSPFNNDWSSSIILSLDPVAIESVALDIMQKEFTEDDLTASPPRYTYVQWPAVDDHLHQAASSDWWPDDITYDPENDGTPIGSLGVHEHWNNSTDMKYSRNLGTGNGIDLVFVEQKGTTSNHIVSDYEDKYIMAFPNPAISQLTLKLSPSYSGDVNIYFYDLNGRIALSEIINKKTGIDFHIVNVEKLKSGYYILKVKTGKELFTLNIVKK